MSECKHINMRFSMSPDTGPRVACVDCGQHLAGIQSSITRADGSMDVTYARPSNVEGGYTCGADVIKGIADRLLAERYQADTASTSFGPWMQADDKDDEGPKPLRMSELADFIAEQLAEPEMYSTRLALRIVRKFSGRQLME